MLHGIDVSKWNGKDSEKHIMEADFVVIRAGYGKNHIDPMCEQNIAWCVKYGKPYGLYWFSYALNEKDARNEANVLCNYIKSHINIQYTKPTLPIFIDFEADSEKYIAKHGITYNKILYNNIVTGFCDEAEKQGMYAGIYCDRSHYKQLMTKKYCVWLAHWDNKQELPTDRCVWMKQYTVDRNKNLDLNILRNSKLITTIEARFNA